MQLSDREPPRITVVTVTFNAENVITDTLRSVINQTYPAIEYIVIDGASSDGTCDIIRAHLDDLSFFLSQPDAGPYDAMNKAIDMANGEWIIFINAGDYFVDDDVVARVFARPVSDQYDFIYGDYIWKGHRHEKLIASSPLEMMWKGICFSHQSLFARTGLMKAKKFDLRYKIVSDYHFYFSCFMEGSQFLMMDFPISVFRAGGLSDVNFLERTLERWKVVKLYNNSMKIHMYYLGLVGKYLKNRILSRWKIFFRVI
jgi:glycosyltransferase involved in cell wall biosynthesis